MKGTQGNRILRLILGCVTLFMAGVIYAWSILNAPLTKAFGWTVSETSFCFTLTLCFFCLGGLFSGLLGKRVSMRLRMLVAAALLIIGFLMASYVNGSIAMMYIGYGVLAATGIGIVYNVVISATNAWFPDKKGLCSGALMMSFGFSALLLGKAANALFAPEVLGWQATYRLLGFVIGAVIALAAFLVAMPKKENMSAAEAKENDIPTAQMIRRASFWKLFIFFTLFAAVGSTAIGFGRNFFENVGLSAEAAVTVAGLLSVCNGVGRLISGALYDRLGLRKTQFATSAIAIIAPLIALLGLLTKLSALGVIGLCLCAFSYGFSPTVSAAFAAGFYGSKYFPLNFSVLNLVLIPASFVSTIAGTLVEATGGYTLVFCVLIALSVVGLLVNITLKKA